eukprot:g15306.t1
MASSHDVVMITGDHVLTAFHVAAECKLVDPRNTLMLTSAAERTGEPFRRFPGKLLMFLSYHWRYFCHISLDGATGQPQ